MFPIKKHYNKFEVLIWNLFCKFWVIYIIWIKKTRIREILLERKEKKHPKCLECGLCCWDYKNYKTPNAFNKCIAYDEKTRKCRLWKYRYITRCGLFPIHPIQLQITNLRDKCRYYWEKV